MKINVEGVEGVEKLEIRGSPPWRGKGWVFITKNMLFLT
jgi:hypothetical protein